MTTAHYNYATQYNDSQGFLPRSLFFFFFNASPSSSSLSYSRPGSPFPALSQAFLAPHHLPVLLPAPASTQPAPAAAGLQSLSPLLVSPPPEHHFLTPCSWWLSGLQRTTWTPSPCCLKLSTDQVGQVWHWGKRYQGVVTSKIAWKMNSQPSCWLRSQDWALLRETLV